MMVAAFNGSPREDGNTSILLRYVLAELEAEGIETELMQVGGRQIAGCTACKECFRNKDQQCSVTTDILNECLAKMIAADGILLGSPTYFTDVTPEMKALIDRGGYVARANGGLFRHKVGAAVVAVRRQGALHAFDSINHLFQISEMIIPGSTYWNMGIGLEKGDVEKDEEGIRTMKNLGQNMAWLLKRLHA
jgi:multimeric flavodoxin WrbA